MQGYNYKRRMVYLYMVAIVAFLVSDYALNRKYEPPPAKEAAKPAPVQKAEAKSESRPVVRESPPPVDAGKEAAKAAEPERAKLLLRKQLLNEKKKGLSALRKQPEQQKGRSVRGALVVYNRVPEEVRINVTSPDGKRIEKRVLPLKSVQIEVPIGSYSIRAFDSKNNSICSDNVTVNDELGAAYYVKF